MIDANPARSVAVADALRQAAVVVVCLVVASGAVGRLRPDDASSRALIGTPFIWAAVVWVIVLLLNATVFDRSHLRRLEREPLRLAAVAAVATLAIGIVGFNSGSTPQRLAYLAANALGSLVFWWAMFSLAWLLHCLARGETAVDPAPTSAAPTAGDDTMTETATPSDDTADTDITIHGGEAEH